MDVWVNFANATKWQAEGIFKCFFPSRAAKEKAEAEAEARKVAEAESSGNASGGANNNKKSSSVLSASKGKDGSGSGSLGTTHVPVSKRKAASTVHAVPILEEEEINVLAKRFAEQIPEDEMSVASLQGYLLKNKTRPRESVEEVAEW